MPDFKESYINQNPSLLFQDEILAKANLGEFDDWEELSMKEAKKISERQYLIRGGTHHTNRTQV